MLRSRSILVFAGLNSALNSHQSPAVHVVRTRLRKTVERNHREPSDLFAFFALALPLLVDCNGEPAERHVVLAITQFRRRSNIAHYRYLVNSTHACYSSSLKRNLRPPVRVNIVSSCVAISAMPCCTRVRRSPVVRRSSALTP